MDRHNSKARIIFLSILFFGIFGLAGKSRAASWYVDNAVSSSGNGQSWSAAWKSFSNVVWGSGGVSAGDTLYISGGSTSKTYTASGNGMLTVGSSGSSGARITIATGAKSPSPSGHSGKVIFNGSGSYYGLVTLNSQNYITLDGESSGASNWTLQNTVTSNSEAAAVEMSSANNAIITYLTISNIGMGIYATYANTIEVSYCSITGVSNDAAIRNIVANNSATGYGQAKYHHNTIQTNNNSSTGAGPDGIQSGMSSDIYNNTFYSLVGPVVGAQHPDFIQSAGRYHRIFNNTFRNPIDSAVDVDAGPNWDNVFSNFRVYNNVFTADSTCSAGASWPSGVRVYNGSYSSVTDVVIANNTFVDFRGNGSDGGQPVHIVPNTSASFGNNIKIQNNLFYNTANSNYSPIAIEASAASQAQWGVDYNLINAGAYGSASIYVDGASYAQVHNLSGAPSFVSYSRGAAGNDYHLSPSDTAAKGQGTDLSVYFTTDKDGNTRSGSWNVGAYGSSGGTVDTAPAAPTGLVVN